MIDFIISSNLKNQDKKDFRFLKLHTENILLNIIKNNKIDLFTMSATEVVEIFTLLQMKAVVVQYSNGETRQDSSLETA